MSDQMYNQCVLTRYRDMPTRGTEVQTTWIPKQFAVVGKVLALKDGNDWSDGWTVSQIGVELAACHLAERSQDWRRQREASDVRNAPPEVVAAISKKRR